MSLNKNSAKFALAFFLGLPASSVFAQVQNLPDTVVSATGIPTDANQIASSVTVITEDQIQLIGIEARVFDDLADLETERQCRVVRTPPAQRRGREPRW